MVAGPSRVGLKVCKVSMLAKFQDSPLPKHWTAMKHVLRYLKGTTDMGLLLPRGEKDV